MRPAGDEPQMARTRWSDADEGLREVKNRAQPKAISVSRAWLRHRLRCRDVNRPAMQSGLQWVGIPKSSLLEESAVMIGISGIDDPAAIRCSAERGAWAYGPALSAARSDR